MKAEQVVNVFLSSTINVISVSFVKQVENDVFSNVPKEYECNKYMELMDRNFSEYQKKLKNTVFCQLNLFDATAQIIERINKRKDFEKNIIGIGNYFSYAYKGLNFPINLGTYYSFANSFIEKANKMSNIKLLNYTSNLKAIDRLLPSDDNIIELIWKRKREKEEQPSDEIQSFCNMIVDEVVSFLKRKHVLKNI